MDRVNTSNRTVIWSTSVQSVDQWSASYSLPTGYLAKASRQHLMVYGDGIHLAY